MTNVKVDIIRVDSLEDLDELKEDDFLRAIILPREDRKVVCNTFDGRGSEAHSIRADYCFYNQKIYSDGNPSSDIFQYSLPKSKLNFRDGSVIFTVNIVSLIMHGCAGYKIKRNRLEKGGLWQW